MAPQGGSNKVACFADNSFLSPNLELFRPKTISCTYLLFKQTNHPSPNSARQQAQQRNASQSTTPYLMLLLPFSLTFH